MALRVDSLMLCQKGISLIKKLLYHASHSNQRHLGVLVQRSENEMRFNGWMNPPLDEPIASGWKERSNEPQSTTRKT